ncbi:MAG: MotA/TolQ/ExbB proton channel family protein [Bacteroidales bacterium]
MMVFEHFYQGGPTFMSIVYLLWIVVIIMTVRIIYDLVKGKKTIAKLKKENEVILFTGSFAFLVGVLGQVIGMFEALKVMETVKDISPALLAGGLRVSIIAPLYGLTLFIISGPIWFVFRQIIRNRARGE